ncbi:hypothetical protein EDB85DRAFT_1885410 [Lactarius pseudohatsudake]|nr:hypothetical protein EDB85DRAFT_1885410 [Lactarius pseudohatsudake]
MPVAGLAVASELLCSVVFVSRRRRRLVTLVVVVGVAVVTVVRSDVRPRGDDLRASEGGTRRNGMERSEVNKKRGELETRLAKGCGAPKAKAQTTLITLAELCGGLTKALAKARRARLAARMAKAAMAMAAIRATAWVLLDRQSEVGGSEGEGGGGNGNG